MFFPQLIVRLWLIYTYIVIIQIKLINHLKDV